MIFYFLIIRFGSLILWLILLINGDFGYKVSGKRVMIGRYYCFNMECDGFVSNIELS